MSNGNNCGCGSSSPVQPGNQIIVPPGTHIVQQPCATVPPQYAPVMPSVFSGGSASGANPNPQSACAGFANPAVSRTFVSVGTNQTGSFFSECAGIWGLPGLILYFPSHGQVEVLGVSQNSVTYRNRTIAPGTEILEGSQFAVGIPMPPVEVIDNGGDDGGNAGGGNPVDVTYQDATQLSNIRGVLNNIPSRIVPIGNHVLVGRQGFWQRRQLGQMRYPVLRQNILTKTQSAQTQNWTVTLPGKPALPDEVAAFGVELHCRLWVDRDPGPFLAVRLSLNGYHVMMAGSTQYREENSVGHILDLAKDATTFTVTTTRMQTQPGNMNVSIDLLAYHY